MQRRQFISKFKVLIAATIIALAALLSACGSVDAITIGSAKAGITVQVPRGWIVSDEAALVKNGDVPKGTPFVAVAAATGDPVNAAFTPSTSLWVLVTVEDVAKGTLPPPSDLYLAIPDDLQQSGEFTSIDVLVNAHNVKLGGLSGSAVAATVSGSSGNESFYDVVYTNKSETKLYLVCVGGSATTYSKDIAIVKAIIASVKVGSAA